LSFFLGPCPHRDRASRIGSKFCNFYLTKTSLTLSEPDYLLKMFRLLRLNHVSFCVENVDMDPMRKSNEYCMEIICGKPAWKLELDDANCAASLCIRVYEFQIKRNVFAMEHDVLLQMFFSLKENWL